MIYANLNVKMPEINSLYCNELFSDFFIVNKSSRYNCKNLNTYNIIIKYDNNYVPLH